MRDKRLDCIMRNIASLLWLVVSIGFTSCASVSVLEGKPVLAGKEDLLGFMRIGKTSRQEIYLELGYPSADYEYSRILTYRIGKNEQGLFMIERPQPGYEKTWYRARYSLVLVFDETGVLQKKSLVQVRAP